VRERRRSIFFAYQAPRIAEVAQPVKVEEPKVVPPEPRKLGLPCTAAFLFVPAMGVRAEPELSSPAYSIAEIAKSMCIAAGVEKNEMFSPRRVKPVVQARQIAMMLCKMLATGQSLPQIGRKFSGRDHTTVLHAVRKFEWMMPILKAQIPEGSHPLHYANMAWDLYKTSEQ